MNIRPIQARAGVFAGSHELKASGPFLRAICTATQSHSRNTRPIYFSACPKIIIGKSYTALNQSNHTLPQTIPQGDFVGNNE